MTRTFESGDHCNGHPFLLPFYEIVLLCTLQLPFVGVE